MKDFVSGVSIWIIFTCGILIIWNTCKGKTRVSSHGARKGLELEYEIDIFFEEMKKKFKEKIMKNFLGSNSEGLHFREMFEDSGNLAKNSVTGQPGVNISTNDVREFPLDESKDIITSVDKLLYSKTAYYTDQEKKTVLDRLDSSEINTRGMFPTKAELKEFNEEPGRESRFKNLEYTDNVEFVKKAQEKVEKMVSDSNYGSWKPLDYFDTNMFSIQ